MPLDMEFMEIARRHFNPFRLSSGTELVSPLLYSLARMLRPRTIIEYGSGYSTLFLLRALADNLGDIEAERDSLRVKTHRTRLFDRWSPNDSADSKAAVAEWVNWEGAACCLDPLFYRQSYRPRLFSFERLPDDHEYAVNMRRAVESLGHASLFSQICGRMISKDTLPIEAFPIDWAWNDYHDYPEFFSEFWEQLNPSGGLMIFHNVTGWPGYYEAVRFMVEERAPYGDLECLVLEEPHKLYQNGCTILRRTKEYRPRFSLDFSKEGVPLLSRPQEIIEVLKEFV